MDQKKKEYIYNNKGSLLELYNNFDFYK